MTGKYSPERRFLLLSAVFMFLIVLIAGGMAVFIMSDRDLDHALQFTRAAFRIHSLYPDDLDPDRLLRAGMSAMFEDLDRYSGYVDPKQFDRLSEELSGSYSGVGVSVIQHEQGLLLMSVREDGPAAEVGLLTGDIIIQADSIELTGMDIETAAGLLRGPEDSEVQLHIFRPVTRDTLEVVIARRKIDLQHIPYAGFTPDSVIYIRLLDFDAGATDDLKTAIDSLINRTKIRAHGLILDLRGNPGGLFTEAFETANLFLDAGQLIVGTESRSRWNEEQFFSDNKDITGGLPMAVIMDRGSASAAEIVAGALAQLDRAVLVGDTTFGKGLVQGFTRFPDGSGLRLTISRYYLHGGLYLNQMDPALNDTGLGLAPDLYVAIPEREEFPLALESSLLLQRFANENQDEIINNSDQFRLDNSWIVRFERFARQEGFEFESSTTELAHFVLELTDLDNCMPATCTAAQRLENTAREDDHYQFVQYGDYIMNRLRQIACERRFGIHTAYDKVIVRERRDIRTAAKYLRETYSGA